MGHPVFILYYNITFILCDEHCKMKKIISIFSHEMCPDHCTSSTSEHFTKLTQQRKTNSDATSTVSSQHLFKPRPTSNSQEDAIFLTALDTTTSATNLTERKVITNSEAASVVSGQQDTNQSSSYLNYNSFNSRLETYTNWPKTEKLKISLAKAGFIYSGTADLVYCPLCRVEGFHWKDEDDPIKDHKQWEPGCQFLPPTSSVETDCITELNGNVADLEGEDIFDLYSISKEILKAHKPHHSDYATFFVRLQTYTTWPKSRKQTPIELCKAGFFYSGSSDETICFHCGGGLRDWEDDDDPWEQHAFWFKRCAYVLLEKGPNFVMEVNERLSKPAVEVMEECQVENWIPVDECEKNSHQVADYNLCKICLSNERNILFLPCKHILACLDCTLRLTDCAICRTPLKGFIRVFIV